MKYSSVPQLRSLGSALLLSIVAVMSVAQPAADPDAIERARKLAESPYRWIILADQIKSKRSGGASDAPANTTPASPAASTSRPSNVRAARTPSPAPPVVRASAPVQSSGTVSQVSAAQPNASNNTSVVAVVQPSAQPTINSTSRTSEKVVFELFDASEAKVLADGSIADPKGGFFLPTVFTYSESKPNPVQAKFAYEEQSRLVSFSYDVPNSVGYFGGAGVIAYAADDGSDLSDLIKNERATGVVVLRLGAVVETRIKVSIIGPKQRNDASYPFFILPLKPGIHTYGLELADFKQPPWVKDAPSIEDALRKVVGVSVEYARGNANGLVDKSEIRVGDIRFSSLTQ